MCLFCVGIQNSKLNVGFLLDAFFHHIIQPLLNLPVTFKVIIKAINWYTGTLLDRIIISIMGRDGECRVSEVCAKCCKI